MKSSPYLRSRSRHAGLALVLAAFVPALLSAEEPVKSTVKTAEQAADRSASKIEDYRDNNTEMNKAEVKVALDQIDAELKHLENLADAAATPEQKDAIKAQHKLLKQRRDDLKKDFTRARYEAFKADLRAQKEKFNDWRQEKFSDRPAANAAVGATHTAAGMTSEKITEYRADASDVNKAEVKASLERLDADIDLLDAKIDAVKDPVQKDALKMRLKALKERRSELNSEFRKARYDALVADVKGEWNKLVN